MATYTNLLSKLTETVKNDGMQGYGKNLFDYLDKTVFSQPSEIKAFSVADLPCPPQATCLGTIEAIIHCAGGISGSIRPKSTAKCPVRLGVINRSLIASKNPTRVFTDQSGSLAITKACVTMTPEFQSVTFDTDAMTDECNDCGDFAVGLTKVSSEAIFLGTEADLLATFNANAGTAITATGDLYNKLWTGFKAVRDVPTNRNKEIEIYCNQSVIDDLMRTRDDNRNFVFDIKSQCPITGCQTVCVGRLKLTGVDDQILPIISGSTMVYFVCKDNVYRTESPVEQKSKTWDQCCLENMNNRIVTMNWISSKIDATMFPNTVKKMAITL